MKRRHLNYAHDAVASLGVTCVHHVYGFVSVVGWNCHSVSGIILYKMDTGQLTSSPSNFGLAVWYKTTEEAIFKGCSRVCFPLTER